MSEIPYGIDGIDINCGTDIPGGTDILAATDGTGATGIPSAIGTRDGTDGTGVTDGTGTTDIPEISNTEIAALLAPAQAVAQGDLDRLHAALGLAAAERGDLDIAYRTLDTPVGLMLLAATDQGVVRVAFDRENHDAVLETLGTRISPRILRAPARLDALTRELDEYFAGIRHGFDVPLDLRLTTGFRRSVIEHLPDIRYGDTESYAEVARATGRPKAVRAVGTACATNPLPLVVPCHRVVRSDGSFGNYAGGAEAKRILLALEAASA